MPPPTWEAEDAGLYAESKTMGKIIIIWERKKLECYKKLYILKEIF